VVGKDRNSEGGPGNEMGFRQQEDVDFVKLDEGENLIGLRGGPIGIPSCYLKRTHFEQQNGRCEFAGAVALAFQLVTSSLSSLENSCSSLDSR